MIPQLEEIVSRLDEHRRELQALKIRVNALEMIWGEAIREESCSHHGELLSHMEEMEKVQGFFKRCADEISELGGQVKGLEPPLIDFYGVQEGHLVFWCWTRGEERIDHWHHLDEGFSERHPVVE